MERDELIESLEEAGVPKEKIQNMLDIVDGKKKAPPPPPGIYLDTLVEEMKTRLITEKDPAIRTQLAAKIISLGLSE